MKKRILVLGIAFVLFALVVGVAFAANNTNGVIWVVIEGKSPRLSSSWKGRYYMEVYNSNEYAVRFLVSGQGYHTLEPKETKHFGVRDDSGFLEQNKKSGVTQVTKK